VLLLIAEATQAPPVSAIDCTGSSPVKRRRKTAEGGGGGE
jgi:hypothetical protein